jgi:hypothetical protein
MSEHSKTLCLRSHGRCFVDGKKALIDVAYGCETLGKSVYKHLFARLLSLLHTSHFFLLKEVAEWLMALRVGKERNSRTNGASCWRDLEP